LVTGLLFFAACSSRTPIEPPPDNNEGPKPNQSPKVSSVTADPASLAFGQQAAITVAASDPDNDQLSYEYSATGGTISGNSPTATFVAGNTPGAAYVTVVIRDGRGGNTGGYVVITIR